MSDDPASIDAFKWEQRMAQIQRLRTPLEGVDYTVNADRNTAALTICNLMLDAKELNEEIVQLRQQVADLRGERDEARREICQSRSTSYPHDMTEVYEIADSRGWDCFKEQT